LRSPSKSHKNSSNVEERLVDVWKRNRDTNCKGKTQRDERRKNVAVAILGNIGKRECLYFRHRLVLLGFLLYVKTGYGIYNSLCHAYILNYPFEQFALPSNTFKNRFSRFLFTGLILYIEIAYYHIKCILWGDMDKKWIKNNYDKDILRQSIQ